MVNIDGSEVAPGTAAAFFSMRDAFGQRFPGCVLLVSDGLRTMQQQQALWEAYQNGTGNLAAYPDPSAPHIRGVALDLRDSWNSPGVATGWNERADWLRSNCGRWGFAATGYGFSSVEPWHYEYQGDPWNGTAPSSAGAGQNLTSRPTADIQRLVGADPDGVYGPDTTAKVKAWQAAHGLAADGIWGPMSDAAGFPPGAPAQIAVDGQMGPQTAMKLQERLGVTVDGQIGPETTRALQSALGIPADGEWGPQTARSLQVAVGATVDGQMGPETVSKLQAFLNTGQPFPRVGDPAPAPSPAPVDPPVTERTPTYPGASKAYNVPLGDGFRAAGVVVDRFIIHHTAATGDQLAYFQQRNDRESCPNYYVRSSGEVIELIPPDRRPSSTGSANSRSVAVEVQNMSGAPDWGISEASREAVAKLAAWLSKQTHFGAYGVSIPLNRTHVIGHNEAGVNATACPGPSMNVDGIVDMARAFAEPEPEPTTEPEPTPTPVPEPPKGYPVPTPPNVPSDALSKLNSILPAKIRDWLYITYALLGVAATGFTGYLTSVQALAPEWFVGGLATYAAIGPFVAIIAKANLNEE